MRCAQALCLSRKPDVGDLARPDRRQPVGLQQVILKHLLVRLADGAPLPLRTFTINQRDGIDDALHGYSHDRSAHQLGIIDGNRTTVMFLKGVLIRPDPDNLVIRAPTHDTASVLPGDRLIIHKATQCACRCKLRLNLDARKRMEILLINQTDLDLGRLRQTGPGAYEYQ